MPSYKPIKRSCKAGLVEQVMSLSADAIEGCDDLLIKILLFLPARPLFTFKLVSKRWFSVISDPHFASLWRPKASSSGLILKPDLCEGIGDKKYYYIPIIDKTNSKMSQVLLPSPFGYLVEILNSCGGLLLCRNVKQRGTKFVIEFFVCNPTTQQFTTLPRSSLPQVNMTLAFDHSISPHYKAINLSNSDKIEIYTSETNSWKQSGAQFPQPCQGGLSFPKGVFFKGAIFWIILHLGSIFYFDIDRDILHPFPVPKTKLAYLGSVQEHLYLVGSSGSDWPDFDIFELGNDHSSWCLKYHIDRHEVARALSQTDTSLIRPRKFSFLHFKLLSVMAREGNKEPFLVVQILDSVFGVDLKDYTCNKLLELPMPDFPSGVHHVVENPFW